MSSFEMAGVRKRAAFWACSPKLSHSGDVTGVEDGRDADEM